MKVLPFRTAALWWVEMTWQLGPLHISKTVITGLISKWFLTSFLSCGRAVLVWQRVVSLCHTQVCVDKVIHQCAIFILCNLGYLNPPVIQNPQCTWKWSGEKSCKHSGSQSQILLFWIFVLQTVSLQSSSSCFCCVCCFPLLVGVFVRFVSSHQRSSLIWSISSPSKGLHVVSMYLYSRSCFFLIFFYLGPSPRYATT